ncbi:MAG: hypothetical protein F6K03_10850 [Kamptonema sp. SIO4C4]|nr:hypothetical protein [Kamptonema sp. SIO4C4]
MRLLSLFCFVCLTVVLTVGCTSSPESEPSPSVTPSAQTPEMRQIAAVVKEIKVEILESQPTQLALQVQGEFQDGCDVPIRVEQNREDQQINIQLYRQLPENIACASVITEFEKEIRLDGQFASGTYTLDVNGEVETVTIQ